MAFVEAGEQRRGHEAVGDLRPQVVHDQQVAAVEVLAEILETVLEPSVKGIPGQRVEQAGGAEIEDGTAPLEKLPGDAAGEEALAGAYGAVEEKVPAGLPELPYESPADAHCRLKAAQVLPLIILIR